MPLRTIDVTRYVTPLREGGSLPAIVEADDDGLYVLKFRDAGQGPRALIAELVAGELARALGLPVPEIVFARLDSELARTEPDPEIQDLIRVSAGLIDGMLDSSTGLNLALGYLPGSTTFDPVATTAPRSTFTTTGATSWRAPPARSRWSRTTCCCASRAGWSKPTSRCRSGSRPS